MRIRIASIALLSAALIGIVAMWNVKTSNVPRIPPSHVDFNARSAMAFTRALAEGYPGRVTGTASSRRATRFLSRQFRALGYRVTIQPFSMWLHGKHVTGQNVIAASARPRSGSYVALIAHYDEATTSRQAAEDDASGVGTVLELARLLRGSPQRLLFVGTDAEEWGMIGARRLAGYLRAQGNGTVISIDYVNAGAARGLQLTASGQFSGYTPVWLRGLALAAAKQETGTVVFPAGLNEWTERAIEQSFQDQGPLLDAGIPAINLLSVPSDRIAALARYHTPSDSYFGFEPRVFAMVGRTAERLTRALARPELSASEDGGFMLSATRYLPERAVWWMQFLALLPLVAAAAPACRTMAGEIRQNALLLAHLAPPLTAIVMIRLMALYNVLPRYELDPATTKDPFLYHLPPQAVLPLIAVLVLGYAALYKAGVPVFKKDVLLAWSLAVVLAAFAINPYGMWLYLGAFAYAALLFAPARGVAAVGNMVLLLLAALPFAAILYVFGREIFLGPYVLWYLVLQVAYGVWSPAVAVVAAFSLVLWTQYVRLAMFAATRPAAVPATGAVFT